MMFVLFLAGSFAFILVHFTGLQNPRLEILGNGELRIHSRQQVTSPLVYRTYQHALGFTYVTSSQNAVALRQKFHTIDGESFTPHRQMSKREILSILGHQVVETQTNQIMQVTYAFCARGRDFIMSGNRRVNLQIAQQNNRVTVGWPVILGSF